MYQMDIPTSKYYIFVYVYKYHSYLYSYEVYEADVGGCILAQCKRKLHRFQWHRSKPKHIFPSAKQGNNQR